MTNPGEPQLPPTPGAPAPDPGEALPVIPDVTLQREIARGGMGVVYRGRQAFLERDVAVKLLAGHLQGEPFTSRFRREARILAGIKHPNIVACHTAGTTASGQSYLVMEFVDGPNLNRWIAEHGALAVPAALRLTRELASALGHAADLGVIHRDVKPENVLLETPKSTRVDLAFPYVPKLGDLGLARMTYETGDLGLTRHGAVMGTLGTMAPEQFDAPDAVDFRADIYGLGCVLYHMLTGGPAFTSTKLTEVVAEKRRPDGPDPCAKNAAIPAAVGRLVARMLAAKPDDRPANYPELTEQLDELIALHSSMAAAPAPVAAPAPAAPAAPRMPDAPLLVTAEIQFLAAGGGVSEPKAAGFPAPSEILPRTFMSLPRVNAAEVRAVKRQSRRRRGLWITGAVGGLLIVAAVPMLKHELGETPAPAPPVAHNGKPAIAHEALRGVAIHGPEGTIRPRVLIELNAETMPAACKGLTYQWTARPEGASTLASPTAASTTLQVIGLPGDAFTVAVEVGSKGDAPLMAERGFVLDYPATDLFADFFEKNGDWLGRQRPLGEWTRRKDEGGIACIAPETPTFRTRSVPGTTWRLDGLLLPERQARRGFAQAAVCLQLGLARKLALVCEREGSNGENWTMSVQEVEREEARGTFTFHPLAQGKVVKALDRDGRLSGASYTITRRDSELEFRFGFPVLHETAELREHVRNNNDAMMLTLFARGGRAVFPKLELW
jgi:serine/threonine-protein kinase